MISKFAVQWGHFLFRGGLFSKIKLINKFTVNIFQYCAIRKQRLLCYTAALIFNINCSRLISVRCDFEPLGGLYYVTGGFNMKNIAWKFNLVLLAVLFNSVLNDWALELRGIDSLGNRLIYDTDLNITWYDFICRQIFWPEASEFRR